MKKILIFCVLYLSATTAAIASNYPFGLHGVFGDIMSVRELNVKQVRIAALTWGSIEPHRGFYDFRGTDRALRNLQWNNVRMVVATIRDINKWGGNKKAQQDAKRGNPQTAYSGFPSDIQAWRNFIRRVVERYDGDGIDDMPGLKYPIKYWQIEGEWMWQWKDTTANYLKFLRITYNEIKKADPSANVIAGAITGSIAFAVGQGFDKRKYFEKDDGQGGYIKVSRSKLLKSKDYWNAFKKANALLKNGKHLFDVLDIHLYSRDAYRIPPAVAWVKSTMRAYGYSKPVWSLENAGPFYEYSNTEQAREVTKRYILSITSGIKKTFWSSLRVTKGWADKYRRLSLIDSYDRRKAAFYTYKLLVSKIDGFRKIVRLDVGKGIYAFKIIKRLDTKFMLWSDSGAEVLLFVGRKKIRIVNTVDLSERTLTAKSGWLRITLQRNPIIIEKL